MEDITRTGTTTRIDPIIGRITTDLTIGPIGTAIATIAIIVTITIVTGTK
jgi:hypothetical protein